MRSNKIEDYKKNLIKLTDYQREVLVGTLLGDGHLETQNGGRTYRLKIEYTFWQKDYADWLYQIFRDWVLTLPQLKIIYAKGIGERYRTYWFNTVSHATFRFYAHQFYNKKRKILPKFIKKFLSPLAMAVWFMDDGSIKSDRNRALILNTQSFTKSECSRLSDAVKEKFGIETTLRPQQGRYQLYIGSRSVGKFVELIEPYILPSMRYKLGKLDNIIA